MMSPIKMKPFYLLPLIALVGCDGPKSISKHSKGQRENLLLLDAPNLKDLNVKLNVTFPASHSHDWPQAGGNASHFMNTAALKNPVTKIMKKWVRQVGTGSTTTNKLVTNITVAYGNLYGMDTSGIVKAFDHNTGTPKWTFNPVAKDASETVLGGGLACEEGKVFIATSQGEVIALDAQTGKELWRHHHQTPFRIAPTIKNGRVFAIDINNEMVALKTATGQELWTHKGISESASLLGGASAAVTDSIVVATYSSGEVYGLSPDNGYVLWSEVLTSPLAAFGASNLSHIRARPVIEGNNAYIVSHGGRVIALDLHSGVRLWQQDVGGLRSPALIGNYLYMITNNDQLVAINKLDGKIAWTFALPVSDRHHPTITWAGPVSVEQTLVLSGSNGQAIFVSPKENKIVHSITLPSGTLLSPVAAQSTLYFYSENGTISAWN